MIERYQTTAMRALWSDQRKYEIWRDIEIAACEAMAERGEIPADAARTIAAKAGFDIDRIDEIEAEVHHDVIAFLTSMAEHIGPDSRHVHLGMTSSDLLDTTLAVQLVEAGQLILGEMDRLDAALVAQAQTHKRTPMMGRSHGVHAEPTSFGLKMLVFVDEMRRARKRFAASIEEVRAGAISGPVGTYAHIDPAIEAKVCERLGLLPAPISTQIIQRDRHAAYASAIAQIGGVLEQLSVEIRHLQRTEVREAEEPFAKGQKGSSAMPHKRNPILTERLTGMARLLRSYAIPAFENVALWHERDISHSSVERIAFPDSTTLLHYMLGKACFLIEGLVVHPERMRTNLDSSRGLWCSGSVLLALARAGISREEAYRIVQAISMRVWDGSQDFATLCRQDSKLNELVDAETLEDCFSLERHLQHVDTIFVRVLGDQHSARSKA